MSHRPFWCLILMSDIKSINDICRYNDDVINWKHFPRYWPFVRGIHRTPVNPPPPPPAKASNAELWSARSNKRLSKQSWGWWFETPPGPLWRYCNDDDKIHRCTGHGTMPLHRCYWDVAILPTFSEPPGYPRLDMGLPAIARATLKGMHFGSSTSFMVL